MSVAQLKADWSLPQLLHFSATDTVEAFIGLAVNTIKVITTRRCRESAILTYITRLTECMRQGAVMSATALELVMENEQVLNPTDVLARHPYIAEAVENKVPHSSAVAVESIGACID